MTDTYHRGDLSIDQQLALKTAATRLQGEFDGTFGKGTIERFPHSSYDQFAAHSTVPNFLPLLAERFARQRLHALARVEGHAHDDKPTVLFLCVHNAGRSQMALGFFQHLAGDRAVAWSGGSEPGYEVNPSAIAAMAERGIDISGRVPQALDRRVRPRRRRGDHDWLRRRLPGLPRQALPRLDARRPGGQEPARRARRSRPVVSTKEC